MISRRNLLKLAGAGATLAVFPQILSAADTQTSGKGAEAKAGKSADPTAPKLVAAGPNSAIYRFRLGDWEATSFAAGIWDIPEPHPMFAPEATKDEFAASLDGECLSPAQFRLYFNVLLLRTGKENILIDTGFGPSAKTPFSLAENLAAVGLSPDDITKVFLTHAHGDHMGGLRDASGKPAFPRAELLCTAEEKAFWTSAKPDFSRSHMDAKSAAGMIERARELFAALPFTTITQGTRLPEGIQTILAPGHTPGHMTLRFESHGEMLYHMVDIAHHFAVMLPHPDWTVSFDNDVALAVATRRSVLARLAGEKIAVFGYHVPAPGLGRIQANGAGYRWVPRTWDPHL